MRLLLLGFIFVIINLFFKGKKGTYLMFLGILIVMGLQGKAGWDYLEYEINFILFKPPFFIDNHNTEICWLWLYRLFSFTEFPVLVFFVSFVQYLILVIFVNKYIKVSIWKNFAFFLFFFTQSFLGFQISALRQGLAIELLALSFILIADKKYILAILCTIAMYNIHRSSLLTIPFIILFYFYCRYSNKDIVKDRIGIIKILPIIFISLYFFKDLFFTFIVPIADNLSTSEFKHYVTQLEFLEISPLIVIYDLVCIIAITLYLKDCKGHIRYLCYMSIIAFFGEGFLFGLSDLPRLTYYFSIFNIIVLPNVGLFLYNKYNKYISIGFVLMCCIYALKTFMPYVTNPEIPRIMNFKFIFEL